MKVLFSDNTLWGLLNFRLGVITKFVKLGYDVVLVAPIDAMYDMDILPLPSMVRHIPIEMSRTSKNPLDDLAYYKALKTIYRSEKPDYIFHYTIKPNIYGTLAAKSLGIRSSAMIAGLGYVYCKNGIGNSIARLMYKYAMRFPEKVMVLNKENYDKLLEQNIVPKHKLLWLKGGEGIDLVKFSPLLAPNNQKIVFLMICRVLYDKGYLEYIETARALKSKAIFRLMGAIDSNPSAVKRETIIADVSDGTIEYIEFTSNVIEQIAQSDCIVLPSYYGEGLSRVLMEALASARPIITTNIPGCRETVDDTKNGFIVVPKSIESLEQACDMFLKLSDDEKNEMAKKSRQKAESQFDQKKVIETYLAIINQKI